MTRTEEEALLLWSELQAGHPTMSDIELIEHHMELAKQEVSKQQRAAALERASNEVQESFIKSRRMNPAAAEIIKAIIDFLREQQARELSP